MDRFEREPGHGQHGQRNTGVPLPSASLVLRQGGSTDDYVPSPGSRCYREYVINGILVDGIAQANEGHDTALPRLVTVQFVWSEFFGASWMLRTIDANQQPKDEVAQRNWRGIVERGVEIYGAGFAEVGRSIERFLDNEATRRRRERLKGHLPFSPMREHRDDVGHGRSFDAVEDEKRSYHAAMLRLAERFSGASRTLVEVAVDVAFACHFNHFRGGPEKPHYTSHLLEVAARVATNFDRISGAVPTLTDAQGQSIDPCAVAIAVAMVHDSIEDFHENFRGRRFTDHQPSDFQAVARDHLYQRVNERLGSTVADAMVEFVETLSHAGDDDFPTSGFLTRACAQRVTRAVRLADIDHNLSTFPHYAPAWASMVTPAQYLTLVRGTPFASSVEANLLRCIAHIRSDELLPWAASPGESALDIALREVRAKEGAEALVRIGQWYEQLEARLTGEPPLPGVAALQGEELQRCREGVALVRGALDRVGRDRHEPTIADVRITATSVAGVAIRVLGPVVAWSGEIQIDRFQRHQLEYAVERSAALHRRQISGYLIEPSGESVRYRVTRIPRRADCVVPGIDEYRESLHSLQSALMDDSIAATVVEEGLAGRPRIRAVFGLVEGYLEQRRRQVLEVIGVTIQDLPTARALVRDRLGDLVEHGIDLDQLTSVPALRQELEWASWERAHDIAEVREHFAGIGADIKPISIFAASPGATAEAVSTYEEDGFVIELASARAMELLVAWADKTRQARFSVEHLSSGEAYNIELLKWSTTPAAMVV